MMIRSSYVPPAMHDADRHYSVTMNDIPPCYQPCYVPRHRAALIHAPYQIKAKGLKDQSSSNGDETAGVVSGTPFL